MIVFLTLCYCGVLALLVKFGVVKWTLWWKLSPLAWMFLLLVVFFIPMQWGAPTGPVNVYQGVVEVVPNVAGEVIDVPVEGLKPVNKGDVLFRIDPVPYEAIVDQLKAQLADAKQNVERLKASAEAANATVEKTDADIELAKADQVTATASVTAAMAALQEAKGKKEKAVAVAADLKVQITAAQREYDRTKALVAKNAVSQSDLDIAEIKITGLKSQLNTAEVDVRVADDTITRSQADVTAAESGLAAAELRVKQLAETELPRVRANAKEAELAANSMIGDEHTSVAAVRAQLENAEYDLDQTIVRAPSVGVVIGMSLRPGQRVTTAPVRSWMSFVPSESTTLIAGVPQYALRHVRPGQKTEVTLKLYPGRVFSATVDEVAYINTQGQLQPSGTVVAAPGVDQTAVPFVVRLRLDEGADIDVASLRGGAVGTAAVYTNKSRASHLIRRVMIRMEAWMNYIVPW
jgi:multidrug resistance efflux pump